MGGADDRDGEERPVQAPASDPAATPEEQTDSGETGVSGGVETHDAQGRRSDALGALRPPSPLGRGAKPIFVCDASAEAERLLTSLRNRGYATVDVPLGMLPSRVRYELPALVVCDADAHEAISRIHEMRDASSEEVLLLFVGHDDGALRREAEFRELATATLTRPLNLTATVDLIQSIVGSPPEKAERSPRKQRRKRAPVLVASARKPYRSDSAGIERGAFASSRPPEAPTAVPPPPSEPSLRPPDSLSILSESGPASPPSSIPPSSGESKLSAETRALLDEGRRRVTAHPAQPTRLARFSRPDEHSIPAAELLRALQEPLLSPNLPAESTGGRIDSGARESEPKNASPAEHETPAEPDAERETHSPGTSPGHSEHTPLHGNDEAQSAPPSSLPRSSSLPGLINPERATQELALKDRGETKPLQPSQREQSLDAEAERYTQLTASPVLLAPESQSLGAGSVRRANPSPSGEPKDPEGPSHSAGRGRPMDEISATSELVGGPIPERSTDRPASSSNAVTLAPPRRFDTERPEPPNSEPPPEDQTNPGGRPPTHFPHADGLVHSLGGILPRPLSRDPPPLDDLSDLLMGTPEAPFAPLRTPAPPTLNNYGRQSPQMAHLSLEVPRGGEPASPRGAVSAIGRAIRDRKTGSLAQEDGGGVRRILLREGDILTATSSREDESLTAYLQERGDITRETARSLSPLPHFGRHAGAALIARGILRQEDLWPMLRAHAEWLIGQMLLSTSDMVWEAAAPARVSEEPAVFGGAAGAEVYMDLVSRVIDARSAHRLLGAGRARLGRGENEALLGESALEPGLERRALNAAGADLNLILEREPELLPVLLGLTELGVLSAGSGAQTLPGRSAPEDGALAALSFEVDEEAFRKRIFARRALVDCGDYFTILGVSRSATRTEVQRAKDALHRELSPARLTPRTAHLREDLDLILRMVDEAHDVLKDDVMRLRYRTALEDAPP